MDRQQANQLVFDRGAVGILRQNEKSADDEGNCFLRHPTISGRKCFVGHVIPDDVYLQDMEADELDDLRRRPGMPEELAKCSLMLLGRGQYIHDFRGPDQWSVCLRGLAKEHDLSTAAIDLLLEQSEAAPAT